jgi:two-component system, LytTR family, sensor histidine kinase AgrC
MTEEMIIRLTTNLMDGITATLYAYFITKRKIGFWAGTINTLMIAALYFGLYYQIANNLPMFGMFIVLFIEFFVPIVAGIFLFKISFKESLFSYGIYFVLNIFLGVIVSSWGTLVHVDMANYDNNISNAIIINLPVYIANAIIFIFIYYFEDFFKFIRELKGKAVALTIAYTILDAFILGVQQTVLIGHAKEAMTTTGTVILALSSIVFLVLSTVLVLGISKATIRNEEIKQLRFYNERLSLFLDELSRFKHGYDNTIASIRGYVQLEQLDELNAFLDDIGSENYRIIYSNISMLKMVGNAGIIGLLSSKMEEMRKKGIDFKLDIRNELKGIKIKTGDACEALGILLDNAIEAADEAECKWVKFSAAFQEGSLTFKIENTYGQQPVLSKIFEKGYSTKGEKRGIGLWLVKRMVEKIDDLSVNAMLEEEKMVVELVVS